MTKTEKQKCEYCLYLVITGAFFLILSYVTPNFDRQVVRDIMGVITALSSLVGVGICVYVARFLSHGCSSLNRRLKHVYIMTAFVLACTMGMGVAGFIDPPLHVWDKIYNLRTLAVVLEIIAVGRFVQAWVKIGRG